jgi:RNA polymerase sigma factor (sigma-70 family)
VRHVTFNDAAYLRAAAARQERARAARWRRSGLGTLLRDERLARLAQFGSERAFALIYELYCQQLYSYCYLILYDADDAYDVLRSALTSARAALRKGERAEPLHPWLFGIAHKEAILLTRTRSTGEGTWPSTTERLSWVEDRAGERARLALLAGDLRELPDLQRGALLMRELTGLPHQDIATALGVSKQAVKQAIFNARGSLSEFQEGRSLACAEVRRTISHGDGRTLRRRNLRAHMRKCSACAAFAAAIPARRVDLHILAPPLAPVLASNLLAQLSRTGSGHGGGGLSAGAAGKTLSTSLAAKTCVATAIAVTAGAGASGAMTIIANGGQRSTRTRPAQAERADNGLHRGQSAPVTGSAGKGKPAGRNRQLAGGSGAQAQWTASSSSVAAAPSDSGGATADTSAAHAADRGTSARLSAASIGSAAAQIPHSNGAAHAHDNNGAAEAHRNRERSATAGPPGPTHARSDVRHPHGAGATTETQRFGHTNEEAGLAADPHATAAAVDSHDPVGSGHEASGAATPASQPGWVPSVATRATVLGGGQDQGNQGGASSPQGRDSATSPTRPGSS